MNIDASFKIFFYMAALGCGLYLGKASKGDDRFWQRFVKVLVALFYPCLVLDSITAGYTRQSLLSHAILPIAGFGMVLTNFLLIHCYFLWQRMPASPRRSTQGVLATLGNYIFIPWPLTQILWGPEAARMVVLCTLGFDLAVWTLGVSFFHAGWRQLGKIFNPPLCSLFLAITLVFFEWDWPGLWQIPRLGISYLAPLMVPLAMLYLGRQLGQAAGGIWPLKDLTPVLGVQLVLSPLLLCPLFQMVMADPLMVKVLSLISLMPSAIVAVVITRLFGGEDKFAAQGVLISHVFALVTVPLGYLLFIAD